MSATYTWEQLAEMRDDRNTPTLRSMVRRGHRTSQGRQLVAVWTPVHQIREGDTLAGLAAGRERDTATAELERALKSRTYAAVVDVQTDDVGTQVSVVTRMGSRLTRGWLNRAYLPVLVLEESSQHPDNVLTSVTANPDHGTTAHTQEATS